MSAGPFRSHLLQQWARTAGPPAAVVPWLRASSSHVRPDGDEDDLSALQGRHHEISLRRRQSPNQESRSPSPPSLSSVDTAAVSAWDKSTSSSLRSPPGSPKRTSPATSVRMLSSTSQDSLGGKSITEEEDLLTEDNEEDDSDGLFQSDMAEALQSLMISRRTASKMVHSSRDSITVKAEQIWLRQALRRAVDCAQMAPNHKKTEPFSFRRVFSGSESAQQVGEIVYNVTLNRTNSIPNARAKRDKWLDIPAFLVAVVHDNQKPIDDLDSYGEYDLLPYTPPETERQLEDYAAACSAVQNILLSLHAEGIGSKWATGPVIQTPAFRELVQAGPSDRIVALIMVGGTTDFKSEREASTTAARRQRRRPVTGDVLQDLP